LLGHLGLARDDFASAVSLAEASRRWAKFQHPGDVLTVFHSGTARLLACLGGAHDSWLVLKAVDLEPNLTEPELEGFLIDQRIPMEPIQHRGRAGKRLANAIAFVRHLNALGNGACRQSLADKLESAV
jgi:hypothetical protein